jgi:hypothetical protein
VVRLTYRLSISRLSTRMCTRAVVPLSISACAGSQRRQDGSVTHGTSLLGCVDELVRLLSIRPFIDGEGEHFRSIRYV